MGIPRTFMVTCFSFSMALFTSTSAQAGPLSEAVEREIRKAVDSTLAGEPHQFPSEPLVAALISTAPKLAKPSDLTELAVGLASAYPDHAQRDPEATEVINAEGDIVRQVFARFLIDSSAVTRASDRQMAVKAFVKLLSLETSEPTRAAVLNALSAMDSPSLGEVARGLRSIAEHDEDDFGFLRSEVLRAQASLTSILESAASQRRCDESLLFARSFQPRPPEIAKP